MMRIERQSMFQILRNNIRQVDLAEEILHITHWYSLSSKDRKVRLQPCPTTLAYSMFQRIWYFEDNFLYNFLSFLTCALWNFHLLFFWFFWFMILILPTMITLSIFSPSRAP